MLCAGDVARRRLDLGTLCEIERIVQSHARVRGQSGEPTLIDGDRGLEMPARRLPVPTEVIVRQILVDERGIALKLLTTRVARAKALVHRQRCQPVVHCRFGCQRLP